MENLTRTTAFALLCCLSTGCASAARFDAKSAGSAARPMAEPSAPGAPAAQSAGDVDEESLRAPEAPAGDRDAPRRELAILEKGPAARGGVPGGAPDSRVVEARGPMLVYTANVTMAVFDLAGSVHDVEEAALAAGGFLARRDDHSITVRVPVSRFQDVMSKVAKVGDVLHRDVVATDVTEEFADLEVRLKNARAMRERMEQLLAKATTVQDSIAIEKELGRIASEIERMEGRMKFLRDRAAYSTITVRFEARRPDVPSSPASASPKMPFPWLDGLGLPNLMRL